MQDLIGYNEIIDKSMRLVVSDILKKIEKTGLIGKHYFVISFLTRYPGVSISKSLLQKYPDEMTIVIQYQYKNLLVEEENFRVSLSFGSKYEKVLVPYKSITSFSDPSINFCVRFSTGYGDIEDDSDDGDQVQSANKNNSKGKNDIDLIDLSAKVISLDAFRKNKDKQ
jgi:hypothetical protein